MTDRSIETNSMAVFGANGLDSFGEDDLGRLYAVDIDGRDFPNHRGSGPGAGDAARLTALAAAGLFWRRRRAARYN